MAERVYLTVGEVLQIHHQQIDNYGGAPGLRDNGLLEFAVFHSESDTTTLSPRKLRR